MYCLFFPICFKQCPVVSSFPLPCCRWNGKVSLALSSSSFPWPCSALQCSALLCSHHISNRSAHCTGTHWSAVLELIHCSALSRDTALQQSAALHLDYLLALTSTPSYLDGGDILFLKCRYHLESERWSMELLLIFQRHWPPNNWQALMQILIGELTSYRKAPIICRDFNALNIDFVWRFCKCWVWWNYYLVELL